MSLKYFFDTDKHQMLSGTRDFPVNEKCPVVKKEKLFVDDNTKMKSLVKVVSCPLQKTNQFTLLTL